MPVPALVHLFVGQLRILPPVPAASRREVQNSCPALELLLGLKQQAVGASTEYRNDENLRLRPSSLRAEVWVVL